MKLDKKAYLKERDTIGKSKFKNTVKPTVE